ncbi:MAG: glycosyltransferase family 61 protein [Hydrococcus sp. SU_1_0]|nr:glycosyltransferase family 61 protein [Hydrococcus sp. SU_1_0]
MCGFTIVDFNFLSVPDRISYFKNAKCIVTNNSDYLDNIFSCEVGTKIISIISNEKISNLHWILCNVCSLEHYHVTAKTSQYNSSIVDLNSLESILVKSRLLTDKEHN